MLREGIQSIQNMAGKRWTNYNASDPGITLLEYLCYGLLDLGYKSTFPMEDMLSDKRDKILTKDRFYTAREVLFSNPLTISDFRKVLIDRVEGIKNAWVVPLTSQGCFQGSYEVYLELNDELKLKWVELLESPEGNVGSFLSENTTDDFTQQSLNDPAVFKVRMNNVIRGADALLSRHRNLGEIFTRSNILRPVEFKLQGNVFLLFSANLEETIAWMFYSLNNYFSRFIEFHTYEELREEGNEVDDILLGPRLENGFIKDKDLLPLRESADPEVLKSTLVAHKAITSILSFGVSVPANIHHPKELGYKEVKGLIEFHRHSSPFFDHTTAASIILDPNELLTFYHGEREVKTLDQAKINSYYESWTTRKAVSSYHFEKELGPLLPHGKFRDVKKYHSIQQILPEQFGLKAQADYGSFSAAKSGKIKQLKAYLLFFEQILADHQAQMDNLDELLSFNSAIRIEEALCQTYYSQGLYNSPGIQEILKPFRQFQQANNQVDVHLKEQWDLFRNDPTNPYENFLSQLKDNEERNVERKDRFLKHVLARFGESFAPDILLELNPHYGTYSLANIESISELLKHFALYSENISRSYFNPGAHPAGEITGQVADQPEFLFTGLEYKFGIIFQLKSYYKGILDMIRDRIGKEDAHLKLGLECIDPTSEDEFIVMNYMGQRLLEIPADDKSMEDSLEEHLEVLEMMVSETKGFVLIDNSLLISHLQNEQWSLVKDKKALTLQKAKHIGEDDHEVSKDPVLNVNLRQVQDLMVRYEEKWKDSELYAEHIFDDETVLTELMEEDGDHNDRFVDHEVIRSDDDLFHFEVGLYLPRWITKVNQPEFEQLFMRELTRQGPVHLNYNIQHLDALPLTWLLILRKKWFVIINKVQNGGDISEDDLLIVKGLLKFIKSPHDESQINL